MRYNGKNKIAKMSCHYSIDVYFCRVLLPSSNYHITMEQSCNNLNVTRQPQNKKDTTVLQKTYHRCSFLWLVVLYSRTTTDMSFVLPWNIRPLLLSCEKVLFVDVDQFETRSVACYTLINQLIKIISTHASLPRDGY